MWGAQQMNSMSYIKAILFDLDGIIIDTESIYMNLMLKFNDSYKIFISKEYYISNILGKTKNQISSLLKEDILKNKSVEDYWKGLLKYRENYINENEIKVKNGFFDFANYLKKNKIILGIVTSNSLQLVKKLLRKAEIDINIFDIIVTSDDVSATKPNPELYLTALKKINIKSRQAIAIEDSNVGIMSAVSAGIKVINVPDIDKITATNKENCLAIVQSLDNIINIFEERKS